MEYAWRAPLKKYLRDYYVERPQEWFDFTISTSGLLNMTIVSERFKNIALQQRREQICNALEQLNAPTSTGFLSLYTLDEAESIGLSQPSSRKENAIYSWSDLADQAVNTSDSSELLQHEPRIPRTIAFYSFKGGVGRTTALTHVAAILTTRGRKVVAIDLDLEAPGLSSALNLNPLPQYGIVDYFYERAYLPKEVEPSISVAEIFGEVSIPDAPGRLFIVPAGTLSLGYITKCDDLRANTITEQGKDLWSIFYREITEQLQPDVILVDSRTGINEWGAFSLLRAADKAIVFLYPNEQNRQGIDLLLEAIAGKIPLQLVFSPVPFGEGGTERVKEHWLSLQSRLDMASGQVDIDINEDVQLEEEAQTETAEPITIQYFTELALASNYPVPSLLSHYMNIANVVDEDTTETNIETILSDTERRWTIIKSLQFPEVDATTNQNLDKVFQRTADFDRFLDDTTCLIRGRKGTGKSALYWLLLSYKETAQQLSRKRLDSVNCLSGHGKFRIRPTRDEFRQIDQLLEERGGSWEAAWRAYLLLRMQLENRMQQIPNFNISKFRRLRLLLSKVPKATRSWQIEHTNTLIEMATDNELNLLAKDALGVIGEQLGKNRQTIWFLYDDLDEDLIEKGGIRGRALTGLFQLVQACDAQRLKFIGFKIFLREDIWSRLVFDNKSHFNGRDIGLQWTRVDFLRLALRQALQSKEFEDFVGRLSPVGHPDQADEPTIDKALQLLWGLRRERSLRSKYVSRWAYDRLTDATGTTFPRSLNILLNKSKEYELTTISSSAIPTNCLLRPKSLSEGLVEASKKRCQEIREEYPELEPFFDYLPNMKVLSNAKELEEAYQKTVKGPLQEMLQTFVVFDRFLRDIGLLNWDVSKQAYRFADIYTYGFNIYRKRRRY